MTAEFEPMEGNSFTLRALGGDPDGRIHYTVIKETKKVLLYFQVNPETELIHVLNRSSPEEYLPTDVQYVATGGLKDIASKMVIEEVTGEEIAYINDNVIQFPRVTDLPNRQFCIKYVFESRRIEPNIEINHSSTHGLCVEATIKANKKGSCLTTYFKVPVTPLYRLVILLAAMKFYYSLFKYSSLPIPGHIPSLMPQGSWTPGLRDILKYTNYIRLRASCESETGDQYIDLLDANTRFVLMVVETRGTTNMKASFFDSFGDKKYYSESSFNQLLGAYTIDVYTSDGQKIGSCDTDKYYDACLRVLATKELLGNRINIYKVNEQNGSAVAVDEEESSSVVIRFCEELDGELKALIIADVLAVNHRAFNAFEITVPMFKKYPFREKMLLS